MTEVSADVVIVGGGPSGVAAAVELRRLGVKHVVVLEREAEIGGATRHCSHSPFGMQEFRRVYFGKAYGRRLAEEAAKAGVDVRLGHSVVTLADDATLTVASTKGVETIKARRVLLATGVREMSRSARLVSGDRPIGVVTTGALQSYIAFYKLMPFRRPLIVGSELISFSALLTCLTHGARPVAMIEPEARALARAPVSWFSGLVGVPLRTGTRLVDIRGRDRVEAAVIRQDGADTEIACDGILLTGRFIPEAALLMQLTPGVDAANLGPSVDQDGRMENPLFFAAGNVLRPVETGGWAFREGRAIGAVLARDLTQEPSCDPVTRVTFDPPIKLAVPNLLRPRYQGAAALEHFQLRFSRPARGTLSLELDGRTVFSRRQDWLPERRVLVPLVEDVYEAKSVHLSFVKEK